MKITGRTTNSKLGLERVSEFMRTLKMIEGRSGSYIKTTIDINEDRIGALGLTAEIRGFTDQDDGANDLLKIEGVMLAHGFTI